MATTSGRCSKILIVDDEPNVRSSLTSVLTDEGHAVDAVGSGEVAIETLHGADYDVVLLALWLPGMDGLDVMLRMACGTLSRSESSA